MKKILMAALVLGTVITFTGCGDKNETEYKENGTSEIQNQTIVTSEDDLKETKSLAFFNKYVGEGSYTMKTKSKFEGVDTIVLSAYDGDNFYTESEFDGMKSSIIQKDNMQYILDHSSKSYMKFPVTNSESNNNILAENEENYKVALNSGVTEYNGKEYEFEEFDVEGVKMQCLFEGTELKVMKAEVNDTEEVIEIISVEKGVDKSLFEIPADYKLIEY